MGERLQVELDDKKSTHWPKVVERLDDEYDHRQRNVAMGILHDELTSELLATDKEKYIEGAQLALRGANDENYTVRDISAYVLWQILDSTVKSQDEAINELYKQIYKKMKEMERDENKVVRVVAKDILWVHKKKKENF